MEEVESQPMFSPSPIPAPRDSPRVGETHSVRDAENGDATVKNLDINNVSGLDETQDMSTEFDDDPKNGMLILFAWTLGHLFLDRLGKVSVIDLECKRQCLHYPVNWDCNPFLERLAWFINKCKQFNLEWSEWHHSMNADEQYIHALRKSLKRIFWAVRNYIMYVYFSDEKARAKDKVDDKSSETSEDIDVEQPPAVSRAETGSFEPVISREPVKNQSQDSGSIKDDRSVQ